MPNKEMIRTLAWWELPKPILEVYNDFFITLMDHQKATGSPQQISGVLRLQTHGENLTYIPETTSHIFFPAKTLTNSTLWSLSTTLIKLFIQFNLRNILPVSPPDIICEFSREYHYWTMSVSQKKDNIVSLENKQLFSFLSLKPSCKFTWTLMRKRQLHSRGVRPCESQGAFIPWKKWDRKQFFYSVIDRGSKCWWCWQA